MSTKYKLKNEMIVHGYIRQKCNKLCLLVPVDIIDSNDDEIELTDDNKCATKLIDGTQRYIMTDCGVFEGIHCWRVYINNPKNGWLMLAVAECKNYKDNSYTEDGVYGCSSANQYYSGENVKWVKYPHCNHIDTKHLSKHKQCKADIRLDLDKGELNICLVGNCTDETELKLWKIEKNTTVGYSPHFNLFGNNIQIRIAKIPNEWYSTPQDIDFPPYNL
eukprot:359063_1